MGSAEDGKTKDKKKSKKREKSSSPKKKKKGKKGKKHKHKKVKRYGHDGVVQVVLLTDTSDDDDVAVVSVDGVSGHGAFLGTTGVESTPRAARAAFEQLSEGESEQGDRDVSFFTGKRFRNLKARESIGNRKKYAIKKTIAKAKAGCGKTRPRRAKKRTVDSDFILSSPGTVAESDDESCGDGGEALTLALLEDDWLNKTGDHVWTVEPGGRVLFDRKRLGHEYDLVERSFGAHPVVRRRDGWQLDMTRSGSKVLVWIKEGEATVKWRRGTAIPRAGGNELVGVGVDHEIRSNLYSEDVFEMGHTTVWGSFYDAQAHMWGYACCQVTRRHQPCPSATNGDAGRIDVATAAAKFEATEAQGPREVSWDDPPLALRPRKAFESPGPFIAQFVRFVMGQWRTMLTNGIADMLDHADNLVQMTFRSHEAMRQTEASLAPLIHLYEDNTSQTVEVSMTDSLERMVCCACQHDYDAANLLYVELTAGGRSSQADSSQLRTVRDYVRGFRRVLQFCELLRPDTTI
eukprot:TRINITY_DN4323_c0_g1_i1.p1 TRINITY_DN4323_c0_g1~~TRINITY_DN4323_c0_g1_i1.p1  ORF type:complete len:518 (-),score=90.85 TRINITY_DN4323_c0_g1_i1:31-1584(-)